ncbi:MAG: TRAP transporter substrate-binding protein DctP [Verrucomicrobiota bacterium]
MLTQYKARLLSAAVLLVALAAAAAPPAAKYTLKFATLAPEGSAWMVKFDEVKKEVSEATGGQVLIKSYPGGVLGEEKDVLFKAKVGQVDGGGFMGYGVSTICPAARAMMMPLTFDSFEEVDAVFAKMMPYLETECVQHNFVALGWTEVGFNYVYSAKPVRGLADLRAAKPWSIPNDETMTALFNAGKVSTILVPVGDVLTALQTGLIETIYSPPLAAVALQWFTKVKYRNDLRLLYTFGGLFVARSSWEKIPADLRARISEICHRRMSELTQQVRKSNEEALDVMAKNGIQVVTASEQDVRDFDNLSRTAVDNLKGTVFSAESWDLVRKYLAEFRAGKQGPGHGP